MNIYDIADLLKKEIVLHRYVTISPPFWSCSFERCEVKEGSMLVGEHGRGKTPTEAINDYAASLAGKTLVFNAYSDNRQEFRFPTNLEPIA